MIQFILDSSDTVIQRLERRNAELERAEKALRISEGKYRTLFENAGEAVLVAQDDVFKFANPKARSLLGYSADEMASRPFISFIHEEDRNMVLERYRERLAGKTLPEIYPYRIIDRSGKCRWVELNVALFEWDERPATLCFLTYISDRRKAEDTLRKRTKALGERVKELNCLYGVSELMAKPDMSLEQVLQNVINLIPPSLQYPEIACAKIKLIDQEIKSENFLETVWKQSGDIVVYGQHFGVLEVGYLEERPIEDEGPFLNEERLLINAIAERIGKNIQRRQAEESLKRSRDHLEARVEERTAELKSANEQLNQEIERRRETEKDLREATEKIKFFACSIAHDLKNPAIGIHGLMKRFVRLYGHVLDDKGNAYCEHILGASEQIVSLAEDINILISSKEAPLNIESVDLKMLFAMVKNEVESQLDLRKIKWIQYENFPTINADRLAVLRIIRNLLDNALKYGGQAMTQICIGYDATLEHHILTVEDDGIGMEETDSKDIFDVFNRAKTSRGIPGSGLGLATAKEIAQRHGGKIWMQGGKNKGVAFSVSISKHLPLSA